MKVPKYRKHIIYRFTCNHCGTVGEYDPEKKDGKRGTERKPIAGRWEMTGREFTRDLGNDIKVVYIEVVCMRCGLTNWKYHWNTPQKIAEKNKGLMLRPDAIQEVAYEEIDEDEMKRRTGYLHAGSSK